MVPNENIIPDNTVAKEGSVKKLLRSNDIALILGISGTASVFAGVISAYISKKKSEKYFEKAGIKPVPLPKGMSPFFFALKTLAIATVYTIGGFSVIIYGVYKWYGCKDFNEFKEKLRSGVKKSPPTDERTEFESLRDLIDYIKEKSKSEELLKSQKSS